MGFPSKMSVLGNIAKAIHNDGEYIVTITVERWDNKPIAQEEAERVLTRALPTMFIQRSGF